MGKSVNRIPNAQALLRKGSAVPTSPPMSSVTACWAGALLWGISGVRSSRSPRNPQGTPWAQGQACVSSPHREQGQLGALAGSVRESLHDQEAGLQSPGVRVLGRDGQWDGHKAQPLMCRPILHLWRSWKVINFKSKETFLSGRQSECTNDDAFHPTANVLRDGR